MVRNHICHSILNGALRGRKFDTSFHMCPLGEEISGSGRKEVITLGDLASRDTDSFSQVFAGKLAVLKRIICSGRED